MNNDNFVRTEVLDSRKVRFDSLSERRPKIIAVAHNDGFAVGRRIEFCDNVVGNRSYPIRLYDYGDGDPWRFVVGEPLLTTDGEVVSVEDPTVIRHRGSTLIACTKVKRDSGRASWRGELHCLELNDLEAVQDEYLLLSPEHLQDTGYVKELEVIRHGARLHCFFERGSQNTAPDIVYSTAEGTNLLGLYGPFTSWLQPRPGHWDNGGVSTGPVIVIDDERYLMFYNGYSTAKTTVARGEWAIGAVVFTLPSRHNCVPEIHYRSSEPLLWDEQSLLGYGKQIICFASSARRVAVREWVVYAHIADTYTAGFRVKIFG